MSAMLAFSLMLAAPDARADLVPIQLTDPCERRPPGSPCPLADGERGECVAKVCVAVASEPRPEPQPVGVPVEESAGSWACSTLSAATTAGGMTAASLGLLVVGRRRTG